MTDWTQDEIDEAMLDDDEDEFGFTFDCHLDPTSGLCGAAGSEDCEFDCPYRADRDRIRARVVGRRAAGSGGE